ncbi:MAG: selenocysteine-specific translation elongation factor, partial [Rhodomicrobium sp.]
MIIGTAGHIDHGKTSLVRRLTGVDTDRLKEEKARGISIDLGFAHWSRPNGAVIGFVDVPGHEGLVHNMLAGATGIDFVLLVIAADDGIMPQTREHLSIMDLLGLQLGLVALNKCDLVGRARIAEVSAEIQGVLAETGLRGCEIVPVSAVTGQGLDVLASRIDAALEVPFKKAEDLRFRFAIDRCFSLTGLGTTVTGTVLSGSVKVGDQVAVTPSGLEARVRSLHAQNKPAQQGSAGQRCALVLSGPRISKDSVRRGDVLADPALHAPANRIDASLRVLKSEPKPIGQWFPVKVHHAAAEVPGRVVVLSDGPISPGGSGYVQLVLERPLAAAAGDRFVIRDTSSSRTVGGGSFIDLRGPERRRRIPARLARIQAFAESDAAKAITRALSEPYSWVEFDSFLRDRALTTEAGIALAATLNLTVLPLKNGTAALSNESWQKLGSTVIEWLDAFHAANPDLPGAPFEQLRKALDPPLAAPVFISALRKMAGEGRISLDRAWVRRPEHKVRLSSGEEKLLASFFRLLRSDPYRPPRVRDIGVSMDLDENSVRRLLQLAANRGDAEEIAHDHFFARCAVESMARIAVELAQHSPEGKFTAADFRDRLGNGRKVAIQILEFFDRHGFTIRRQDLRRINNARIELFVPAKTSATSGVEEHGGVPLPVGRPDFKSGWDRETVSGGFDSHP